MTPDLLRLRAYLTYTHALTTGLLTLRAWQILYHYARVCDGTPCWWTWRRMHEKTVSEWRRDG